MEPLQTLVPSCRLLSPLAPRSSSSSGCKTTSVLANSRSGRENTPPSHPNIEIDRSPSSLVPNKTLKKRATPIVGENHAFDRPNDGSVPPSDDSVKVFYNLVNSIVSTYSLYISIFFSPFFWIHPKIFQCKLKDFLNIKEKKLPLFSLVLLNFAD